MYFLDRADDMMLLDGWAGYPFSELDPRRLGSDSFFLSRDFPDITKNLHSLYFSMHSIARGRNTVEEPCFNLTITRGLDSQGHA